MLAVIDQVVEKSREFIQQRTVGAGIPIRISAAAGVGDFGWQGDLKITIVDKVRDLYKLQTASSQLVPGKTHGAKHCLETVEGVQMYVPKTWSLDDSYDEYMGPIIVSDRDMTICHPVHETVVIPAGVMIACDYQRSLDVDTRREIRQRD